MSSTSCCKATKDRLKAGSCSFSLFMVFGEAFKCSPLLILFGVFSLEDISASECLDGAKGTRVKSSSNVASSFSKVGNGMVGPNSSLRLARKINAVRDC